ncbi:arylsulfatase [Draconibacterium sediminis]|uniref:Arylsulfatase n=1 Tax=Draconibacterium sediminis TaxID=1544798 RepID=A0A0D8J9G7_9BACT|nr:arylsulfatase [Draconibacterium sediminis]
MVALACILFAACSTKMASDKTENDTRPNILFLLADDLGYGELGCYGQQVIQTPVLDNFAKEGIRFTNFYAGNPVCSPSRAILMTGISSSYNNVRGNGGWLPDKEKFGRITIRKDDVTIAEMLKASGYQTAFIGKWHIDDQNDLSTWAFARGFDYAIQEQWGKTDDGYEYDEEMHWINAKEDSVYYIETEWNCKDEFRTELAFDWLDTKMEKDKPFFLFMSYRAPHAHERYIHNKELYADRGWPDVERRHAAKITLLDQQIGRMLKKLEEMGKLENTLVLFTSDNGPNAEMGHDHEFFNSNGDLKGYKRDVFEGGVRVPTMAYWKGKIEPGKVSDYIGCGHDFMATIADVVHIEKPSQSNGVSFLPILTGKSGEGHEFLNWEYHNLRQEPNPFRQACRIGNMKGVRYGLQNPIEIYDLSIDISENNNIAAEHPELVEQMEKIFRNERSENVHYPYGGASKK